MGKRARVPTCTHIDMKRSYILDDRCHLCLMASPMGFLYECLPECHRATLREVIEQHQEKSLTKKSGLRQRLEYVGLSESVIVTAELGHYTEALLELLEMQKADLRQVIEDTIERSQINSAISRWASMVPGPSNHDGTAGTKMFQEATTQACGLKACHHCRPYFRDRVPTSIQAVLLGDFHPLTRADIALLPVKSPLRMRTIGLPRSPSAGCASDFMPVSMNTITSLGTVSAPGTASTSCSGSSDATFHTTQSDLEGIPAERSPRRLFYKNSRRQSSASSEGTILQSSEYQGLRASAQKWFHKHRLSRSADVAIGKGVERGPESSEEEKEPRHSQHGNARTLRLDGTAPEGWVMHRQEPPSILGPAMVQVSEVISLSSTDDERDVHSSLPSDDFSVLSYDDGEGDSDESGHANSAIRLALQATQARLQHRDREGDSEDREDNEA